MYHLFSDDDAELMHAHPPKQFGFQLKLIRYIFNKFFNSNILNSTRFKNHFVFLLVDILFSGFSWRQWYVFYMLVWITLLFSFLNFFTVGWLFRKTLYLHFNVRCGKVQFVVSVYQKWVFYEYENHDRYYGNIIHYSLIDVWCDYPRGIT